MLGVEGVVEGEAGEDGQEVFFGGKESIQALISSTRVGPPHQASQSALSVALVQVHFWRVMSFFQRRVFIAFFISFLSWPEKLSVNMKW